MADTTSRRKALDAAIEGQKSQKKSVAVSGKKNRVLARMKLERINPGFADAASKQTTDSNN